MQGVGGTRGVGSRIGTSAAPCGVLVCARKVELRLRVLAWLCSGAIGFSDADLRDWTGIPQV